MLKSLLILFWLGMHPVHVAFISMEYSAGAGGINALVKLYSSDFLLDYHLFSKDSLQIDLTQRSREAEKKISNYLDNRIEFYSGNNKIAGLVQDYESVDGEIKVNLFYRTDKRSKIFRVRCRILTDIYSDQTNFLIFRYNEYERGVKLTPEVQEQVFEIK